MEIKNEGNGAAKAPYFSFVIPKHYSMAPQGIDGNGTPGFLGAPYGGSDHRKPQYGARSDIIIHPHTVVEVAAIVYNGREENRPTGDLLIEYEIAAEDLPTVNSSITIPLN